MHLGRIIITFVAQALLVQSGISVYAAEIDTEIPVYERTSGVSGNLSSVGSDTLANLMTLWAEEFKRLYPNVNIQIQAAGSSTAPPALTEQTSNIGPMSREMKDNEIQAFEARYGYKPTAIPVAIDALAVYVHKDNPIEGMTLPQIDAIFSSNQRCGYAQSISNWGDLGMREAWERRDIQLFGRNSVSGTYGYFKEAALCDGDFKNNVNEQPGSASVVQSVSTSINGIGYSGIGYRTSGVRSVPIARSADSEFYEATAENSVAGNYPLARFLYVYVNKAPNQPLPPLEREFIKLILSQSGQAIVLKDGYIALPAQVVSGTMQNLDM
ncbi:MAG: phosphate ABC transporter substrate-binding protein PstS family protein [Proteobacteria bacterium]|nr:phosphate ABC transporter substrate-binding protein PstS family protein [Pseudomonadota bacterium]